MIRRARAKAATEADALVSRAGRASERDLSRARDQWWERQAAAEARLEPALEARRKAARAEIAIRERREAMAYQEQAVEEVFRGALDRLCRFSDAGERRDLLVRLIGEAAERLSVPSVRVKLNAAERRLVLDAGLPKSICDTEVVLDDEAIDTCGGPAVSDASGRLLYDNTFEARLERERGRLRMMAASALGLNAPGEKE